MDGVIYPEVRDRMILLKGDTLVHSIVLTVNLSVSNARPLTVTDQYDLAQCLTDFLRMVIIHGDDVLAHTNWEVGEQWLRTYR